MQRVLHNIPQDITASFFVVLHMPRSETSLLPDILARASGIPAEHPMDGQPILPRHIYIAPPDHHLLIENGYVHLSRGLAENRHRPSINSTFRSAALAFGPRVIGIILSGSLDDGISGLWQIKRCGGYTIVQDPAGAAFPEMPLSALALVEIDSICTLDEIPALLREITKVSPQDNRLEDEPGSSSVQTNLTCPDCRGAVHMIRRGDLSEFSCRIGHTYTFEGILAAHRTTQENALWAAVVALEEGAELARMIASRSDTGDRIQLQKEADARLENSRRIASMIVDNHNQ